MLEDTGHKEFGQALRDFRKKRGLTLTAVASASREIATDSAGRISQPYLSQLERGTARGVTYPKLWTLAALYLVRSEDILAKAPARLRRSLQRQLDDWWGKNQPAPLSARRLPSEMRPIDEQFDKALERVALDVTIPLHQADHTKAAIRDAIVPDLVIAYLHGTSRTELSAFWAGSLPAHEYNPHQSPGAYWFKLVEEFTGWLIYDQRKAPESAALLLYFRYVREEKPGPGALIACGFLHRKLNRLYGHELVPASVVRALRWRQAASLLNARRPKSAKFPRPPSILDCIPDYICTIAGCGPSFIWDPPGKPADVLATVSELTARLPALRGGTSLWDAKVISTVRRMLSPAANPPHAH